MQLLQLYNARLLLVHPDAEVCAYRSDLLQAFLQVVPALVDEIAVVHISAVALDVQLFLDEVVKPVWQHQRVDLAHLTAEAEALLAKVLHQTARQLLHPLVPDAPLALCVDRRVRRGVEVVRKVEYQRPAVRPVLSVVPLQVAGQPIHGKVDALALQARRVVVHERRREQRHQRVIAQAALHHPLRDVHAADVPQLSPFHQVEGEKSLGLPCAVHQLPVRPGDVGGKVAEIPLCGAFPAHALAAFPSRPVQVLVAEYLLKAPARLAACISSPLAFRFSSPVPCLVSLFARHNSPRPLGHPLYGIILGCVFYPRGSTSHGTGCPHIRPPCKQRPADCIRGLFWPCREQALLLQGCCFAAAGYCPDPSLAESEGHAIRIARVVVVGVAVAVDIAEIRGVAAIRRALPPVVRAAASATNTELDPCFSFRKVFVPLPVVLLHRRDELRFLADEVAPALHRLVNPPVALRVLQNAVI